MSFLTPSRHAPICASCASQLLPSRNTLFRSYPFILSTTAVRTKKTSTRGPDSIPVRLLKDIPGYGRKGSLIPLSKGHMRNTFHRFSAAAYLTPTEHRELKIAKTPVVRDFLFGMTARPGDEGGGTGGVGEQMRNGGSGGGLKGLSKRRRGMIAKTVGVSTAVMGGGDVRSSVEEKEEEEVTRVEPEQTIKLLSTLLPAHLDFPRQTKQQHAAAGAAGEDKDAIFGSVTVADILAEIRKILQKDAEASRIVLVEDDVRLFSKAMGEGEGGVGMDRLKRLGAYEVEITVKGTEERVRRVVRVRAGEGVVRHLEQEQGQAQEKMMGGDRNVD